MSFGLVVGSGLLIVGAARARCARRTARPLVLGDGSPFIFLASVTQRAISLAHADARVHGAAQVPAEHAHAMARRGARRARGGAAVRRRQAAVRVLPQPRGHGEHVRRGRLARGHPDVAVLLGGGVSARRGACGDGRAQAHASGSRAGASDRGKKGRPRTNGLSKKNAFDQAPREGRRQSRTESVATLKPAGAIPPAAPSSDADTSPPCGARRSRPDPRASSRDSRPTADRACSPSRSFP